MDLKCWAIREIDSSSITLSRGILILGGGEDNIRKRVNRFTRLARRAESKKKK